MDSSSPKQMNDYWHIPRASLAPSSNSSAVSSASSSNRSHQSHSNPPTVANRVPQPQRQRHYKAPVDMVGGKQKRRDSDMSATSAAATAAAAAAVLAAASAPGTKRGSRSSQGSSDSNNSTRSAASGSLLLTAANLERFAEINKKQQKHTNKLLMEGVMPTVHHSNTAATTTVTTTTPTPTIYNANLVHAMMQQQQQQQHNKVGNGNHSQSNSNSNNDDSDIIITMDPNLDFIKTKDLDSVSIASSMHFTMVNGESDKTNPRKRGLCDRGRQVTVLITSMSLIFLLLIMGMVYALEMRAREMPQS